MKRWVLIIPKDILSRSISMSPS